MKSHTKKSRFEDNLCYQITNTTLQIISSLSKKVKPSRLPWYGSAAYLSNDALMGMGELLCDPTGKGIGELILKRAAPAALEKKDSKGRAAFQLGPPYFGVTSYLLTDPADIKYLMSDQKNNIYNYDYLKNFVKFLGKSNILSMPHADENWKLERKRHEKLLFNADVLEEDIPAIHQIIDGIFEKLNAQKKVLDLEEFAAHYTLDVIAKTKLGIVDFPTEVKTTISQFITNVAIQLGDSTGHFNKAMLPFLRYFYNEEKIDRYFNKKLYSLIDEGNVFLREKVLTEKNKKSMKETSNWITIDEKESQRQDMDLMSEEVRNRMVQFFSAGTETTSRLVMHGIMTLGLEENKHILEKLREEFKSIKNGDVRSWTLADYEKCRYFNAFIDELLRMYPSIPIMLVVGKPKYDKPFKLDDIEMKGGEYFFISPAVTHRLESVWGKDAHCFRPERFLEKDCPKTNLFAYSPFGWTPRPCPGQRFAKLETRLILARMIMEYDLTLQAGLKQPFPFDVVFTMKTALKNIEMQFERRNSESVSALASESLPRFRVI